MWFKELESYIYMYGIGITVPQAHYSDKCQGAFKRTKCKPGHIHFAREISTRQSNSAWSWLACYSLLSMRWRNVLIYLFIWLISLYCTVLRIFHLYHGGRHYIGRKSRRTLKIHHCAYLSFCGCIGFALNSVAAWSNNETPTALDWYFVLLTTYKGSIPGWTIHQRTDLTYICHWQLLIT